MTETHLIIPLSKFKEEVSYLSDQANNISSQTIQNQQELELVEQQFQSWLNGAYSLFENSFSSKSNQYFNILKQHAKSYPANSVQKPLWESARQLNIQVLGHQRLLERLLRIINISDAVINPDIIKVQKRDEYGISEKLDLLLEKLYDLYDDTQYSISQILEGNGIELKRKSEEKEFGQLLKEKGLVDFQSYSGGTAFAKLTTKGALLIEERRKPKSENYNDIEKTPEELANKVDEIIEKLTKLGYGQEILFDELQEIKDMYTKLNKKNWAQLIKGKIIDLALGKVAEAATLNYIYETLTDHKAHLILK